MVYEDIFSVARQPAATLMPRTLHWHREAVATVKYSQDGKLKSYLYLVYIFTDKTRQLPHFWWLRNHSSLMAAHYWKEAILASFDCRNRPSHRLSIRHFLCHSACRQLRHGIVYYRVEADSQLCRSAVSNRPPHGVGKDHDTSSRHSSPHPQGPAPACCTRFISSLVETFPTDLRYHN